MARDHQAPNSPLPAPAREDDARWRQSSLAKRKEPYGWAWSASLAIHLLAIGLLGAGSLLDGCGGKASDEPPIVAKLVRLGAPRDERLLPRLPTAPAVPPARKDAPQAAPGKDVPTPPKQEAPPPPPKQEAKPSPAPAPPPTRQETPQQATAPKKAETSKDRLDSILEQFAQADRRGPAERLPGQADGDPEGDAEEAAEGERYLALLQKRLRDHYILPSTIPEAERIRLQALVRIHIESNGRISDFRIEMSSGNPQYDAALESAVKKSSPLPPPPAHLLRTYRDGFPVRFRY